MSRQVAKPVKRGRKSSERIERIGHESDTSLFHPDRSLLAHANMASTHKVRREKEKEIDFYSVKVLFNQRRQK